MRWSWFSVLASLLLAAGCGASQPGEGDGEMVIHVGSHDTWPTTVVSARIRMTRNGGATGCGTAANVFSNCWCKAAGAGCNFSGDPAPTSAVTALCSGTWVLDTAVTAAYSQTACQAGTELVTTESTNPTTVTVPYGGSTNVTVIFQAGSTANVDVQFDG